MDGLVSRARPIPLQARGSEMARETMDDEYKVAFAIIGPIGVYGQNNNETTCEGDG